LRENGWVEVQRPDSYVYYVNPTARIVADVEMRNDRLFHAVSKHLELNQHKDALESAPEGAAELWLRDAGSVEKGFVPVRWWVIHKKRQVAFDKAFDGAVNSRVLKKEDRECFASFCVDSFFIKAVRIGFGIWVLGFRGGSSIAYHFAGEGEAGCVSGD
jgi:hypothetical protein